VVEIIQEKLGHKYIYTMAFGVHEPRVHIKFTLLNWREYKALSELLDCGVPLITIEEIVWERCILDSKLQNPKEWDDLNAGIISTIAGLVLYLSGSSSLNDINLKFNYQRDNVAIDLNEQIPLYICSAFPAYKPEDLDEMPWPQVLTRLAQAERLLLERQILTEPIKWVSPEEVKPILDFETDNRGIAEI
jgi:hypothetical protein